MFSRNFGGNIMAALWAAAGFVALAGIFMLSYATFFLMLFHGNWWFYFRLGASLFGTGGATFVSILMLDENNDRATGAFTPVALVLAIVGGLAISSLIGG